MKKNKKAPTINNPVAKNSRFAGKGGVHGGGKKARNKRDRKNFKSEIKKRLVESWS